MNRTTLASILGVAALSLLGALPACHDRPGTWNTATPTFTAFGLTSAVVVLDDPMHRALALLPHADQRLDRVQLPIGHGLLASTVSPDDGRLFALSAGDTPRRSDRDEYPSLTVIDGSTPAVTATKYAMTEPLSGLAIDPQGHWAAAFAGPGAPTSFVQNPNEIVLFDLTQPPGASNPVSRTIRSFGGAPVSLVFTPTLQLPGGPGRLLVIETDRDVTLLDLDHAADPTPPAEITVQLTNGTDARLLTPAGVAVDPGDPSTGTLARIAVRTSNDSNVIVLTLGPAPTDGSAGGNDFFPVINLTDVGGIPSDIAFVHTDGGLRVAALVPTGTDAVLVDPDTSVTETVALPAPYSRVSLVTGVTGGANGTDVALLWQASAVSAGGVAFWTLGVTAGQPYRSVEVLGIADEVKDVMDVPAPHPQLKVLQTAGGSTFYMLDLGSRTAAPLQTLGAASLAVAADGERVWAFEPHTSQLADIDLGTLNPVPLYTDLPIDAVFDVARDDGGRALLAMHGNGGVGVTVFDALSPDTATARNYAGLLLEGL
jgi:hypothetical protein